MKKNIQCVTDSSLKTFGKWTSLPRWIIRAWGDAQALGIENAIRADFEESISEKNHSTVKCVILYWPYCIVFLPLLWIRSKAAFYLNKAKKKKKE